MAKWLVKLTHHKGQVKLSIPKSLATAADLYNTLYVILEDTPEGGYLLRRLKGGESFHVNGKKP